MTNPLDELNRDVWRPFMVSYAALDADSFLDINHADLIHASGITGQAHGLEQYSREMRDFFAMVAERGDRISIEFRFQERIATGDIASERGLFCMHATLSAGETRTRYGRFHTFSRKTDERWRLVTDYDTDAGADAAEFEAAAAMNDLTAFIRP